MTARSDNTLLTPDEIFGLMRSGVITAITRVDTNSWRAGDGAGVSVTNNWRLSEGNSPEAAVTNLYRLITTHRLVGGKSPSDLFNQA